MARRILFLTGSPANKSIGKPRLRNRASSALPRPPCARPLQATVTLVAAAAVKYPRQTVGSAAACARSERAEALESIQTPVRFGQRAFSVRGDEIPAENQSEENGGEADVQHLNPRVDVDLRHYQAENHLRKHDH